MATADMKSEIINLCARIFNQPTNAITGMARADGAREARFALYAALRLRGWSNPRIGKFVGRHHATIIHGVRKAEVLMAADPAYAEKVVKIAAWHPEHRYRHED